MRKSPNNSNENCLFYSREKSLCVAWACFRNEETGNKDVNNSITQTCPCNILQYFTAVKMIIFR